MKITKKIAVVLFICATVFTGCSKDDEKENEVVVDTATLKTFKDVSFSLDTKEGFDAGLFFSTETGKSYKRSQIDATILPKIDIAFNSYGYMINFFMSPNDSESDLKNASQTSFVNYVKDQFTIDQFSKLEKGADLDKLTIAADDESFPDNNAPLIILFKNAAGKKGAIHVKSVHRAGYNPRIVTDIKIQK
jgi:hypothetical protein